MAPMIQFGRLYFSFIVLCWTLFFCLITEGMTHVGQPCNVIIKICLASNSYCDERGICRCKPDYPVTVGPHTCKRGARFGEVCGYTEECTYYDNNTYCNQLPYRKTCECYDGYRYNEERKVCKKLTEDYARNTNSILPTAIGLSLAFASVLCCILVLWHICRKQSSPSHWNFYSNNTATTPTAPNATENVEPFLRGDETLPNYDTALSLKGSEDCEPPPSYEEVIQHMNDADKA